MKSQQIIAKERSFVMKLTKKDIENLLHKCGYNLYQNAQGQNGQTLPSIERYYNQDKNEYQIMLRVAHDNSSQLYNALASKIPNLCSIEYNPNLSIVFLTDFSFLELNVFNEEINNNQITYAQFMYQKFGEYYREKYNQNVKKEQKVQQTETCK